VLIITRLIPNETLPNTFLPFTFATHLERLLAKGNPSMETTFDLAATSMSTQVQLSPSLPPLSPLISSRRTQIMSVLNVTPDSFSNGGINNPTEIGTLKTTIISHLASGATIIDIGGQTSKPGAVSITAEEETKRILPAIRYLKEYEASNPTHGLAISIDTYRANVAEQAITAGAHIINDISAGLLDPEMLPTIARLGCTYILMHMRGTPETMTSIENTTYNGDLIQIVGSELLSRVKAAEAAGIRRWRMILDPGIGFAKNLQQNLELLRRLDELRSFPGLEGIPWLVGTSRKGFIGKITGVKEASQRMMGTAATMTAAVQGGADIVRVHDVKEMIEVVKMADALYRGWSVEDKNNESRERTVRV
jgi:2-amino-4-hydroxy-6-hydroxymethyldihydropteridine diphosphokinase/dihydropteroate synthase